MARRRRADQVRCAHTRSHMATRRHRFHQVDRHRCQWPHRPRVGPIKISGSRRWQGGTRRARLRRPSIPHLGPHLGMCMKRRSRALARRFMQAAIAAGVLICGGCNEPEQAKTARPLPALGAKIDETSVSGISSGAYMAGQFQMAHAKRVTGAAIIAGGPYGCSESIFANTIPGTGTALLNLSKAVNGCMLDLLET